MAASAHIEPTTGDANTDGSSPTGSRRAKTDREVAALARHVRDDSSPGTRRKTLNEWISQLKEEQTAQRAERKRIAGQLKNTMKRKRRLQQRARQLTNGDLMEVLLMRDGEPPRDTRTVDANAEDLVQKDGRASAAAASQPGGERTKQTDISDDEAPCSSPGAASSTQHP